MNKLNEFIKIGFQVTWKVMDIGLFGAQNIPTQLSRIELFEYLDQLLVSENEQTDNVIALICEQDDVIKADRLLHTLAENDGSNFLIQLRKWRAYLLNHLLINISKDCLQGLIELMDFWTLVGISDDCPHVFPEKNKSLSVQKYFTDSTYNKLIDINRNWLKGEIAKIIEFEKDFTSNITARLSL